MRLRGLCVVSLAAGLAGLVGTDLLGQAGTVDSHLKAAQAAAGTEYVGLFQQLCSAPLARQSGAATQAPAARAGGAGAVGGRAGAPGGAAAGRGRGTPDRATWYAEPVKVFDNLYFVGQSEFSVWAVNTSDGLILVDAIFDYSVEAEVTEGLKKLGLDPTKIKYVIISHAHADHDGGAKYLQDKYGARIVMGGPDWDSTDARAEPKAKRDIVATDGMKITLGDTTVTVYLTPGHTPGTISTVIPVKDKGQAHTAALWGGTLFNFQRGGGPASPAVLNSFQNYTASSQKMRQVVEREKIDILLSNHTAFDGSKTKLPAVLARRANDPHPYVVGTESVRRFLTMAGECSQATSILASTPAAQ